MGFRGTQGETSDEVSSGATAVARDDCGVTDEQCVALASILAQSSSINALWLSDNQIGDIGATALGEALETNQSLTVLNLHACFVGDAGAAALARGLAVHTALTELNLCGNLVGNRGAAALCCALETNQSLTRLNLAVNPVDSVVRHRAEALVKINEGFRELPKVLVYLVPDEILRQSAAATIDFMISAAADPTSITLAEQERQRRS